MAGVVDKFKKRGKNSASSTDWSRTGSFLHKPDRGWIHPDEQLATDAGICYGVRVSLLDDEVLDFFKLKAFSENVTQNIKNVFHRVNNIERKGKKNIGYRYM